MQSNANSARRGISRTRIWRRGLTRRYRRQDHAPHALVQATEEQRAPHRPRGRVLVQPRVVRRLDPGLDGVEGVDEEIDGDCGKGSGLNALVLSP